MSVIFQDLKTKRVTVAPFLLTYFNACQIGFSIIYFLNECMHCSLILTFLFICLTLECKTDNIYRTLYLKEERSLGGWLSGYKNRPLSPKAQCKESYVPDPNKKKLDFVRTPTMYQALWQAHINQAYKILTCKTDCWCINSSEIELSKIKAILVSGSVHPDCSTKVLTENRHNQNIVWWARAIKGNCNGECY